MNKTVLTIVQTDTGGKEAKFVVTGERNGVILFEEEFLYSGQVNPLNLLIAKEKFMKKAQLDGEDFSTECIFKLLSDITDSKFNTLADYREREVDTRIKVVEVKNILEKLHTIAREINKPFDSGETIVEYNKRYGGIPLPKLQKP